MRKRRPAKIHRGDRRRSARFALAGVCELVSLARREGEPAVWAAIAFEPLRQRRKRLNRLLGLRLLGSELGDMLGIPRLGGGELGLKARLHVAFEGSDEGRSVRDGVRTDIRRAGGDRSSGGLTRTLPSLPASLAHLSQGPTPPPRLCWG